MPASQKCSILCIAPYRLLPATSGGPICTLQLHHHIGKLCPDHIVGTDNNRSADNYAFDLHKVLPSAGYRYIPFFTYNIILSIAKRFDCTAIICEHPYMAPTAMVIARKLNIPWYIRSHNIESERFRQMGKKWWQLLYHFERFTMKKADGVFFITPQDAAWAQYNYGLPAEKCHFIPFGTGFAQQHTGRSDAKAKLAQGMYIDAGKPWLYFLGRLDYAPNIEAVRHILDDVVPRLEQCGKEYQVLIAGKGLPEELQMRIASTENIQYAGYIQDLEIFLEACDVMLNPMLSGGGIKSKAIEALSYNKQVVSTESGSNGILYELCGDNLHITADNDWDGFTQNILKVMDKQSQIPAAFFEKYYWGNIAKQVIEIISNDR